MTPANTKTLFGSKTIVFNLLVAIAAVVAFFVPTAQEFMTENAPAILLILGGINIGLRRVTKSAYQLFPILVLALVLPFAFVGCTQVPGVGGRIYYLTEGQPAPEAGYLYTGPEQQEPEAVEPEK